MNKNSTWNDIIKPVIVLTVLCIVVSGLLGVTNGITQPIIEANAKAAADAARMELLPEATDGFDEVEVDIENVVDMYVAKNGAGYTVTTQGQGYGGMVKFITAFDKDGNILSLSILEMAETPGIGDKINDETFLNQFIGRNEEFSSSNVDLISGTTISSNATVDAMNLAVQAYNQVAKGIVVEEVANFEVLEDGSIKAFEKGFQSDVVATVSFDENGAISSVVFDTASETPDYGTKIGEDASFAEQFIGATTSDEVTADIMAGVTVTSKAAIKAVQTAVENK